mmetsp:Transcript_16405/g.64026  ORF Transcript_16405/g.64026 Transcript_16405/m.64026 type:complete len:271 (-) Transcript_16405:628-1440(-)
MDRREEGLLLAFLSLQEVVSERAVDCREVPAGGVEEVESVHLALAVHVLAFSPRLRQRLRRVCCNAAVELEQQARPKKAVRARAVAVAGVQQRPQHLPLQHLHCAGVTQQTSVKLGRRAPVACLTEGLRHGEEGGRREGEAAGVEGAGRCAVPLLRECVHEVCPVLSLAVGCDKRTKSAQCLAQRGSGCERRHCVGSHEVGDAARHLLQELPLVGRGLEGVLGEEGLRQLARGRLLSGRAADDRLEGYLRTAEGRAPDLTGEARGERVLC